MNTKVLLAVFKRNFISYFTNPLGYVFITVFVWLCVVLAFWPNGFFNANLANLDVLTAFFPFVAIGLVASIAMSIWADERRQGTDELLLTIPATDFDIVLGKYLAAVAIFTVSLLFSLACAYGVLRTLGDPDAGLFLATCVGYWLMGIAMLAIAMVASFLTSNVTVAFVLGGLLNVPLVAAGWADSFLPAETGKAFRPWSIGEQFRDFGRGILTLSGLIYFGMIVAIMLYLSMVLIARRHWVRDKDWYVQAGHYGIRGVALAVAAMGLSVLFHHHDVRLDMTSERLSSLSPETIQLLQDLDPPQPVRVEAFLSPEVPERYVQTRLTIISVLREMEARSRGQVQVQINDTDLASDEATRAESGFGITPKEVGAQTRGAFSEDKIFLGVSLSCGLQKVVLPFIDRGIPVEYELIRSLMTITQQKRKRVGVLRTAVPLIGGPSMGFQPGMPPQPDWPIVKELKKAYEVVGVEPSKLVTRREDYPDAAFDIDPMDRAKMIEKGMELLKTDTDLMRKSLPDEEYPKIAFDIDPKDRQKMVDKGKELLRIKAGLMKPSPASEDDPKTAFDIDPDDREKLIAKGMELLGLPPDRRQAPTADQIDACIAQVHRAARERINEVRTVFDIDPSNRTRLIAKGIELLGMPPEPMRPPSQRDTDRYVNAVFAAAKDPGPDVCIAQVLKAAKERVNEVKTAFGIDPSDREKLIAKGMELLGIKPDRRGSLPKEEVARCIAKVFEAAKGPANEVFNKCIAKVYEAAKAQATYDVLLAVQPSSLNPEEMDKLIGAVKFGQPVAVFEDPVPRIRGIPGTGGDDERAGFPMPQQREIRRLWRLLGIDFSGMGPESPEFGQRESIEVVYQEYNPLVRYMDLEPEFVFIDNAVAKGAAKTAFNEGHPVTSKLQHLLFIYGGWIAPRLASDLECDVLVRTGEKPGTISAGEDLFMLLPTPRGLMQVPNPRRKMTPHQGAYVMAAHFHGKDRGTAAAQGAGAVEPNVILVADLDVLGPIFFELREVSGEEDEMHYDFDNVTFVLNVLDYLAGDDRFLEIRKRRPAHRTLTRIGQATEEARNRATESAKKVRKDFDTARENEKATLQRDVDELDRKRRNKEITDEVYRQAKAAKENDIKATLIRRGAELQQQQQQKEEQIKRDMQREIRGVQDRYKWWAFVLPPIPPLIVGVVVFVVRRVQERKGVSRRRLR